MEYTLPNGTRVKATIMDTDALIKDKLTDNPALMENKAMVEIYMLNNPEKVVEYHRDFFDAALEWAKKQKAKNPKEIGYRVIQILE